MAAGEGRRLRPITERFPKPVLPIDGRPVIVALLHELRAAGFTRATVVTGYLAAQVERLLEGFPLDLRFVRQPRPEGSADAVRRGLQHVPAIVVAADTVFTPGDVRRFSETPGHALAVRRQPPPDPPHRPAVRVEGDRIARMIDGDPENALGSAPLWRLGEDFDPARLDALRGPPYELVDAFQQLIDSGDHVRAVEIGPTRDLTHPQDLIEQNFAYLSR